MTMGAMCEIYSAELEGAKVAVKIPRGDCEEPAVAEHDLEVGFSLGVFWVGGEGEGGGFTMCGGGGGGREGGVFDVYLSKYARFFLM